MATQRAVAAAAALQLQRDAERCSRQVWSDIVIAPAMQGIIHEEELCVVLSSPAFSVQPAVSHGCAGLDIHPHICRRSKVPPWAMPAGTAPHLRTWRTPAAAADPGGRPRAAPRPSPSAQAATAATAAAAGRRCTAAARPCCCQLVGPAASVCAGSASGRGRKL